VGSVDAPFLGASKSIGPSRIFLVKMEHKGDSNMETSIHATCPHHSAGQTEVGGRSGPAHRTLKDLPGPVGLPLLGNILQLDLKKLHTILEGWETVYGPMYKFRIAGKTVVAISDPDLIHEVSRKRPASYRRLESIELVLKELGINGVFSSEGDQWYRQRRIAMQALNTSHLQSFFPTLVKVTERLKTRWEKAAKEGHAVEVRNDLMRYSIDVTSNLAFGYDVNTLEGNGDDIQRHVENILPMMNRRINAPFPYWHFFKLPADRILDESLLALRKAIGEFIAHSRERLDRNPDLATHPTNFLEAMLAAQDMGDIQFTDDEIFGNVLTMLVAGEDTTAYTLAWMIHFLTEHPDIQMHMQQETDTVLSHATMLCDFQDHERLRYIEAATYETLRLKAVVPVLLLEANHAVELGGVRIPAGTAIFLLTRQSGLGELAFESASQFQPERWLASHEGAKVGHNSRAFVPFGVGPRSCPGRNLALLEVKSVMAMLCRNFSISRIPGTPRVAERFSVVMMPTTFLVNFRERESCHRPLEYQQPFTLTTCPYAGVAP
jgi:cytochrome P450